MPGITKLLTESVNYLLHNVNKECVHLTCWKTIFSLFHPENRNRQIQLARHVFLIHPAANIYQHSQLPNQI